MMFRNGKITLLILIAWFVIPHHAKLPVTVEVPGLFSYPVVQYEIPVEDDVVSLYHVPGINLANEQWWFLAHNYLAGDVFDEIQIGDTVLVTYANGTTDTYIVYKIMLYESITPFELRDLKSGKTMSDTELFNDLYGEDRVIFQTCIGDNWGRYFVIAYNLDFWRMEAK